MSVHSTDKAFRTIPHPSIYNIRSYVLHTGRRKGMAQEILRNFFILHHSLEYTIQGIQGNLTAYNFEAMAWRLSSQFQPQGARTETIFKISSQEHSSIGDTVEVCAHSYHTVERVHFEPMYGRDGRLHSVPVHWTEYIPVSQTSTLRVAKEKTADCPDKGVTYHGYYAYKA